jgi:hypothetical protein
MSRRTTTWLALTALAAFFAAPLAAEDTPPPKDPTPPAEIDIGPPGDIVVPQPEEVVPTEEGKPEGGSTRGGRGNLNVRTPHADVHVGESDGVHVRAPYADVRVDRRDGVHVNTPIGPIRIGGRGGMNLRELGDRFGVRVEEDGLTIDPTDALPPRGTSGQQAVLGVQLRDDDGIRIDSVRDGGPADKANLAAGDRVVSMNGYVFDNADALTAEVGRLRPGDRVQLTIERDGRLYRASAALEARR